MIAGPPSFLRRKPTKAKLAKKLMTLATHEFIRRFLIHVLPRGFHRIRHYGLLANGNRAANIERARELLAAPPAVAEAEAAEAAGRRAARAAASLSLLWWPHDRHRDLRTWRRAENPSRTGSAHNQDRPLMRQPRSITNRTGKSHHRRLNAGRGTRRSSCFNDRQHTAIPAKTSRPIITLNTIYGKQPPRSERSTRSLLLIPHSTRAAPPSHHRPRFRALLRAQPRR